MLQPLRHIGELAKARATRRSAERDDTQSLTELEHRPLELPEGLVVEWLGVSGYRISHEGQTLFVDPYLSRVPLRDLILRRQALPDPASLERFGGADGEVVGVLVGHTHFDHAVDAPAIARRFGCKAYGSDSLLKLMALHGLAESTVVVEPYRAYELGPFVVRFTPSVHSKRHRQPGRRSSVAPGTRVESLARALTSPAHKFRWRRSTAFLESATAFSSQLAGEEPGILAGNL